MQHAQCPGTVWWQPSTVEGKETFISKLDGAEDYYVYTPPAVKVHRAILSLFVYFHGMGSTALEPYLVPKDRTLAKLVCQQNPRASFLSPNYRGDSSWLNETAILDVNQNIRSVTNRYPAAKIVLIGTSMGGCSALAYSYLAPMRSKARLSA
jgi:acetyl esterase/lipase